MRPLLTSPPSSHQRMIQLKSTCFASPCSSTPKALQVVKVCGLISPQDAQMVARSFREIMPSHVRLLLGMILWPRSRRSITGHVAREIVQVAEIHDATAVGVFVDEDLETMKKLCKESGVHVAQLHGEASRSSWNSETNDSSLPWIDVRDVGVDGKVSSKTSSPVGPPLWSLFDTSGGGTGKPFDWDQFAPPKEPWLLAGGLDRHNISKAVEKLQPDGVDVASGVAGPDRCSKDERRVRLFMETLVRAYS